MAPTDAGLDYVRMVHKGKKQGKPEHFLREWRKHRGLTLEQVAERLRELAASRLPANGKKRAFKKLGASHGNLSRIERFQVPYNQVLLELLTVVYETDRESLTGRHPKNPPDYQSLWDQIPAELRPHAADVLRTFVRKIET